MRIVFLGTAEFGLPTLSSLVDSVHRIVAVVTAPDRPKGRGLISQPSPVKMFSQDKGIPVLQPENLREERFLAALRGLETDLFVVVAFRILPKEVFTMPRLGTINLHASLLPKYRGAAPIQWAICRGEKVTGVSTFFIDEGVDTGHIILQREVQIGDEETAGQLHDRLAQKGAGLVMETAGRIADGRAVRIPQLDIDASPAPKLKREHGRIDWSRQAAEIRNQIRGLNPFPGAFSDLGGRMVKIHAARVIPEHGAVPGQIQVSDQNGLVVATGGGSLALLEVQPQGKRRMTGMEFVRGYRVRTGDRFGSENTTQGAVPAQRGGVRSDVSDV